MKTYGEVMSPTVLIVAGDSSFLENLSRSLKRLRASIVKAGNKREALEVCSTQKVDLALLDIRQQGNDAMQVLARLKKNQPESEVILLSDSENISFAMEGMRQGAFVEITVPFEINSFRKTIESALQRRKARQKRSQNSHLLNAFENAMMAATFAEAGEFETAQNICNDGGKE